MTSRGSSSGTGAPAGDLAIEIEMGSAAAFGRSLAM
jgi:hypothetical protein